MALRMILLIAASSQNALFHLKFMDKDGWFNGDDVIAENTRVTLQVDGQTRALRLPCADKNICNHVE